jgi:hypothetical protein
MTAIDKTPNNINFLSPLNFQALLIKRAPHVNFFIQEVNVPDINLGNININNPFTKIPYIGDHVQFGDLKIVFKVDEDFKNYIELFNWIISLGFPESHEQYKNIVTKETWTGESLTSDLSLIPLSSSKMPNLNINFVDAYPVNLSQMNFNTTDSDVRYVTATAIFKYTFYTFSNI